MYSLLFPVYDVLLISSHVLYSEDGVPERPRSG
jgi:hypothetical protein